MVTYKHFVIMLFNMRWLWDKSRKFTCTEEWLERRFDLFERYCLPSFMAQTNKDFVWLCLFDKDTPPKFMPRIEKYKSMCTQFRPCFYNEAEMMDWIGSTRNIIQEYLTGETEYVITTSLDNDDAIHKDMIDCIQREFAKKPLEGVYSFKYGYQLFEGLDLVLATEVPHNHFITLTEKNTDGLQTIINKSHLDLYKEANPIYLESHKPYWIEYIQQSIADNDPRIVAYRKENPAVTAFPLKDFGLGETVKKLN